MKIFLYSKKYILENKKRNIRLLKESAWVVVGRIFSLLGSLLLVRAMTELLAPEEYGRLALLLTLGVMVCQLTMSGVMPGIMRFYYVAVEHKCMNAYASSALRLMRYGTCATGVFGVGVVAVAISAGYSNWIFGIVISILFTQLSSYNSTCSSIQNAARKRFVVAVISALDPWLKVGAVIYITYHEAKSAEVVLLAYLVTNMLIFILQIFLLKKEFSWPADINIKSENEWLKKMFKYSRPFVFINAFTWAQASSDKWSLQMFSTAQSVGQYTVLNQLGFAPISIIVGVIINFIDPILNQRAGDGTDAQRLRSVWRVSWLLTGIGIAITMIAFILAIVFHEWIFEIFVAEEYRDVSFLLPWVLLAGGMFSASQVLGMKLLNDLKSYQLTAPKIITSIVAVLLNLIGSLKFGTIGVVVASNIFSCLIFIWMAVLTFRPPVANNEN